MDSQILCTQLLGTAPGGVALTKSLLSSEQPELNHPPGQGIPPWCVCTKCRIMDTPAENVCCGNRTCGTTNVSNHLLCLEHNVLTIAILYQGDIFACGYIFP